MIRHWVQSRPIKFLLICTFLAFNPFFQDQTLFFQQCNFSTSLPYRGLCEPSGFLFQGETPVVHAWVFSVRALGYIWGEEYTIKGSFIYYVISHYDLCFASNGVVCHKCLESTLFNSVQLFRSYGCDH